MDRINRWYYATEQKETMNYKGLNTRSEIKKRKDEIFV